MLKIVMKIDGMACGMCEAHVNDALRRVDGVKKRALLIQKDNPR